MDSRLIIRQRALQKPLLLKDYLLDDMSSCSSNGFKSFPRKQCCTTVRFLHEFDRKKQHHKMHSNPKKPASKSAFSALHSLIAAVTRLPFAAASPPEKQKSKSSFFPRSFSKKIFLKKNSFWKRKWDRKEIVRWKSFDELLKEESEPSDRSCSSITTTGRKSESWSGRDFTASDGGNFSSEVNLDLPKERNDVVKTNMEAVSENGVGVTNGDVSMDSTTISDGSDDIDTNSSTNSKKQWSSEEKEQFSPISVLDCPFDDEDEVSSPFQHRLARMEGTKKKLLKKIQKFECLAKLEPLNLTGRFALQPDSDNESSDSPLLHSPTSTDEKFISDIEEEEEEEEEEERKALGLLHRMKAIMPSYALKLKVDKLLLDFFRERINSEKKCDNESLLHEGLIEEAKDWINGRKGCYSFMECEGQNSKQGYIRDMERGVEWKKLDQEIAKMALELETEVFAALLNELLLDILCEVTS